MDMPILYERIDVEQIDTFAWKSMPWWDNNHNRCITKFYIRIYGLKRNDNSLFDYCIVKTKHGEEEKCYLSDNKIIEINSHSKDVMIYGREDYS